MRIVIRAEGVEEVQRAFSSLLEAGEDLTPSMREIAAIMEAGTRLRFRDGQDPQGRPWRPLSPSTRAKRARRSKSRGRAAVAAALAGNMQPLLDTGRLRNSIVSDHGARDAVVGTNVVYAPIHQFGGQAGRRGRTRIPARPFLGLSVGDEGEIMDALRDHIARSIGPA